VTDTVMPVWNAWMHTTTSELFIVSQLIESAESPGCRRPSNHPRPGGSGP
jgi:hypothetical protein